MLPLATALLAFNVARAGGACAFVANDCVPSTRILQCGRELTVRPAHGARFRPIYSDGQALPSAIRLDAGALLIDDRLESGDAQFQILTPLAIAAVRGTRWAMDVTPVRTSTLVLSGALAVTNRRLNQYVVLTDGRASTLHHPIRRWRRSDGARRGCAPSWPASASRCASNRGGFHRS